MDPPARKRGGLFNFTGLFRSSAAAPAESNAPSSSAVRAGAVEPLAPSRVESANASSIESPVKRASDSQLASRKIISRVQGPSSKLSQSISASEVANPSSAVTRTNNFSSTVTGAPRRMPGDNPYKSSSLSSSTTSHVPATAYKASNFSGASTTPRNMFRASNMYQRPGLPSFSPSVPRSTIKQTFPPNTPGKAPRGATADMSARTLAHTASSELFKMRIPEPPRHLTGEVLAKEIPDDPTRSGSIYADEFLAHYCPPDLDEHQRRQFFCILDLRRLKYAADDVFVKKDWKINILNFAKEYEKSRSLIMLRYGLYEFKTVRASEAVKKEWKQKHGIQSSEDEAESATPFKANVGSKRKASEDLGPSDTALTTSSSNGNKRARAPEATTAPGTNKRKAAAVGEPDENQPSKLLKPSATTPHKTPSATKSMFESIANSTQPAVTSTTPAKSPAKNSLFASSTTSKLSNGTPGRSIFEASSKPPAPASNIFGHLSDTSKGSPNDDADAESETSSNAGGQEEEEEEESEVQEATPSDEPSTAASVDAPTPQFAGKTPNTTNGTSSASSDAGESSTQSRSIFDRITRAPDGQPVRRLPPQDGRSPFAISPDKERSASPVKEQAAPAPVNNTWNTGTPIKFSAPGTSVFGSAAPKPAAAATIDLGPLAKKPDAQDAAQPPASQNMFGTQAKKATLFPAEPPKPADGAAAKPNIFGGLGASATLGSQAFGAPKDKEESKDTAVAPKPAANLFGTAPAAPVAEAPKHSLFQNSSTTLFGNQSKTDTAAKPPAGGLFGNSSATETPASQPAPTFSFGSTTPSAFAASTTPAAKTDQPAAKKPAFGSDDNKPASLFAFGTTPAAKTAAPADTKSLFGASTTPATAPAGKSLFGATPTPATENKPLFGGSTTPAAAPENKSIFGATTTPAASDSKSLFGFGATSGPSQAAKPLFGGTSTGQTEAPKPAPAVSFGSMASTAPAASTFSFGSQATAATQPTNSQQSQAGGSIFGNVGASFTGGGGGTSFTFSSGGNDAATVNNPFAGGATSAPVSFNFGNNDGGSQPGTTSFTFGGGAPPTISFGAGSDTSSQTAPAGGNMFGGPSAATFSFGGTSQPNGSAIFGQQPSSTASMFGNNLAPGGGTSTGTNSPYYFGGASSLATTPATGTPEPAAEHVESRGTNADGDEAPQVQISLTDGGPGEEDESVVHEVRAKAVKFVTGGGDDSDDDDAGTPNKKQKSPWVTQGVGALRILKHKTTGAVRMLLRAEPRGHVALNKLVLPEIVYKADNGSKYVKLTTSSDDGKKLETWMLQVKTPALAAALAESLEANKKANAKS